MRLYYHVTFRLYQIGAKLGLKKFDPFTLAAYHSLVQSGYVISIIGFVKIELLGEELIVMPHGVYILIAVLLIGMNYLIIHRLGIEGLKRNFEKETYLLRVVFDLLIIAYIVSMFILLNYTRRLY